MSDTCKHEQKACPRCGQAFECKAGDITRCQCYGIDLSDDQQQYIAKQFDDCLCRNCLLQLQQRYILFTAQKKLYGER